MLFVAVNMLQPFVEQVLQLRRGQLDSIEPPHIAPRAAARRVAGALADLRCLFDVMSDKARHVDEKRMHHRADAALDEGFSPA